MAGRGIKRLWLAVLSDSSAVLFMASGGAPCGFEHLPNADPHTDLQRKF